VGATFASPDDEHYYGLGQNQQGYLDHRGHPVRCWADYTAPAAPSFCVPFLVTNKGYGLIVTSKWRSPGRRFRSRSLSGDGGAGQGDGV
jgi:alpha-D-xyloside xylohydrolase